MAEHHDLDIKPVPERVLYINEPWIMDMTAEYKRREPEEEKDNVRIYVPVDLNRAAIMRRLEDVVCRYGEANGGNENSFSEDVGKLIYQIEVYDQVWFVRGKMEVNAEERICGHSREAKELVREFVQRLEEIPDGCAECFPFEMIEELKKEYLG